MSGPCKGRVDLRPVCGPPMIMGLQSPWWRRRGPQEEAGI